jgi:hypothetical protein
VTVVTADLGQGFPAPGAGAGNAATRPVGFDDSGPPQFWPTTNSRGSSPRLSAQAKAPRSRLTVASTSPPSRIRTQCWIGRRLIALAKVLRLSSDEARQLAGLAGNVMELDQRIDIDIDDNG